MRLIYFFLLIISNWLKADESFQPFIDSLAIEKPKNSSFIEGIQPHLDYPQQHSFIESEKLKIPPKNQNYLEQESLELEKQKSPDADETFVQKVKEGKTSETLKKESEATGNILAFKYATVLTRNITSATQACSFNDVYGSNYAPEIQAYYEIPIFSNRWTGRLGLMGFTGIAYYQGTGRFAIALSSPDGTNFPQQTNIRFTFITIPISIGLVYRMQILNFLKPYVYIGPMALVFAEFRNDNVRQSCKMSLITGNCGYGEGFQSSIGINILLDKVNPTDEANIYQSSLVHHTYLTMEVSLARTFGGIMTYDVNGLYLGFNFEF